MASAASLVNQLEKHRCTKYISNKDNCTDINNCPSTINEECTSNDVPCYTFFQNKSGVMLPIAAGCFVGHVCKGKPKHCTVVHMKQDYYSCCCNNHPHCNLNITMDPVHMTPAVTAPPTSKLFKIYCISMASKEILLIVRRCALKNLLK